VTAPEEVQDIATDTDRLQVEFIERTVQSHPVGIPGPPHEGVGDGAIYYDEIFDSGGTLIGKAVGLYVITARNPANGEFTAHHEENIHLPDGKLRAFGSVNRSAVITGGWARFQTVGTAGRYAGFYGVRQWRVTDPATLTARVQMSLCR
jgi:hypothetical protein